MAINGTAFMVSALSQDHVIVATPHVDLPRQNKVHRGEREMSSPFETGVAGIFVCFEGSGYVTQNLTLTSDTQLIRIGGMVSGFFWM